MIEPTDEMVHLAVDKFLNHPEMNNIGEIDAAMRDTLAAVLAIVERDYSLRAALCDQPCPTEDLAYCELPRGHSGTHASTVEKAVHW